MTRTFWLSFCDNARPEGERFLGVAVIDVTEDDVALVLPELHARFPLAAAGAEWLAAAMRHAWRVGCNPGGEVESCEVTTAPPEKLATVPRDRLLSKAELEHLGLI